MNVTSALGVKMRWRYTKRSEARMRKLFRPVSGNSVGVSFSWRCGRRSVKRGSEEGSFDYAGIWRVCTTALPAVTQHMADEWVSKLHGLRVGNGMEYARGNRIVSTCEYPNNFEICLPFDHCRLETQASKDLWERVLFIKALFPPLNEYS